MITLRTFSFIFGIFFLWLVVQASNAGNPLLLAIAIIGVMAAAIGVVLPRRK